MHHVLRLAIPTLIAGITLVACASTAGSGTSPTPAATAAKQTNVAIKGFAFSPATITVTKGTKVTFSNQDSTAHTVTSGANRTKDGTFDAQISGGNETQITFDKTGTIAYFCQFHQGMVATVIVN